MTPQQQLFQVTKEQFIQLKEEVEIQDYMSNWKHQMIYFDSA